MCKEIYINKNQRFDGCDFVIQLDETRRGTPARLLQITDMQFIDSSQMRKPDRLRRDEIIAWAPENFMSQCGNHILSLVSQTSPDLIFITGDIIYGSFDDKGTTLDWFCSFMDSLCIPWAPVFGNHDNESALGVDWQCQRLQRSEYCVFKRGDVSGNSNYSVGIAMGDELIRVLHMVDSNGCRRGEHPSVIPTAGIYADQLDLIEKNTKALRQAQGKDIPAFMAFHIPTECFLLAETEKGYLTPDRTCYTLGVDVPASYGDFGFRYESPKPTISTDRDLLSFCKEQSIDGVFVGHCHRISTCIRYMGISFVYGLKTGQYDYHLPGSLGGTLITLEGEDFGVSYVPSLVPYAPMPGGAEIFKDLLIQ